VGQETIARIKTYGHVNRELRGFVFPGGEAPEAGAPVVVGEKEVGRITSVAVSPTHGPIALGLLHRKHLEPGTEVSAGGLAARVVLPGEWA
jgi:glycine cleavage system aminomethyltransferase T